MSAVTNYLLSRFGITLEQGLSTMEAGAGKHIVYSSSLNAFNAKNEETRGLIIGKTNGAFKPSSDFLQAFGWMCTRNVIFLDKQGAKAFCRGKEIPTKSGWCSRGYVAVSFNGIVLGCAFFDGEKALNMVPQHKRIAGGNEDL